MFKKLHSWLTFVALMGFALDVGAEKRDSWLEVRSPHFTVMSNGGEGRARRVAFEFEQIRSAIGRFFSKARLEDGKEVVILAVKDEKSLKQLMPQFWERKGLMQPVGQFISTPGKHLVALRIDAPSQESYHTIYHEYAHTVIAINFYPLPTWLNEGLAEFFGNTVFEGDQVKLGFPDEGHLYLLQERRPLPIRELFAVDHDSPHYNEAQRVGIFYAQSWAVTHYFMLANKGAGQQQIGELLRLLDEEVPETEALQRAFGDLDRLDKTLNAYVKQSRFGFYRGKTSVDVDEKTFAVRELTPAESAQAYGEYLVAENRPLEARALLNQALALEPNLPGAYESLGLLSMLSGDEKEASRSFRKAVELGSKSFFAHFSDATLSARGNFSGDPDGNIEKSLQRSIELNPNFAPALSSLARVYASRGDKLDEALALAQKANALQPGVPALEMNVASVLLAMGRTAEARSIAERVLARAKVEEDREFARTFLYLLSQIRSENLRVR